MYVIRDIQHHLWSQSLSFIKSKSIIYHISFRLVKNVKVISMADAKLIWFLISFFVLMYTVLI